MMLEVAIALAPRAHVVPDPALVLVLAIETVSVPDLLLDLDPSPQLAMSQRTQIRSKMLQRRRLHQLRPLNKH